MTALKCIVKSINRTHVNIDVATNYNRTLRSFFLHIVVYLQASTNEYRQSGINVWENLCGFFKGANGNILSKIIYDIFRNYTNFNHACPYRPGVYFVKWNKAKVNFLNFGQFLPAGRFRIDINFTDGYKGEVLQIHKTYFSISDHRLDIF